MDVSTGVLLLHKILRSRRILSLRHPDDAGRSITDLILRSIDVVLGDPVNEALFSPESRWMVISLEFGADLVVERLSDVLGPVLERRQSEGQLYPDLDLRETTSWINAFSNLPLAPPLVGRALQAKRTFTEHYLLRALIAR